MGPLHALRGTCEVVRDRIQMQMQQRPHYGGSKEDEERNCELLERAALAERMALTTWVRATALASARLALQEPSLEQAVRDG